MSSSEGFDILQARICDLLRRAEKCGSAASGFLDLSSARAADVYLSSLGLGRRGLSYCFCGGYPGAERRVLVIVDTSFCPYGCCCDTCLSMPGAELSEWLRRDGFGIDGDGKADADSVICPIAEAAAGLKYVLVRGSGYHELDHRSFLGAVLALGLSRDTVGDIVVRDGREAIIITVRAAAELLLTQPPVLTYVGRDKVAVREISLPPDFAPERRFEELTVTVASPRLDAVVSELARLSRDKAKAAVTGGAVTVSGRVEQRPDREVGEGDVISVRGCGKFVIGGSVRSSRGRLRISVRRYI